MNLYRFTSPDAIQDSSHVVENDVLPEAVCPLMSRSPERAETQPFRVQDAMI